jgi:hypothetical protein
MFGKPILFLVELDCFSETRNFRSLSLSLSVHVIETGHV